MNLRDIFLPWIALRQARADLLELEDEYDEHWAGTSQLIKTNLMLLKCLEQAHFRNPKTGRLGKRGQMFEGMSDEQ